MAGQGSCRSPGLKMAGGTSGVLGVVTQAVRVYGGDPGEVLIDKTVGVGGEQVSDWLEFVSGGTRFLSGAYLPGKSQLPVQAGRGHR